MGRDRHFRVETVRGEPFYVGDRKLIPEVRVVSFGKAKGTIGLNQTSGWGTGFAHITPLGIVEETAEGERRIATPDTTATAVRSLLAGALAVTLVFVAIRWLARRLR
jgi:hypothetical protein